MIDPWPRTVQAVKFGSEDSTFGVTSESFELKKQVAEFIERVRVIESGEIRQLEVRYGLPFAMQLECRQR